MNIPQKLTTEKSKFSQIPIGFTLLAKEELQKEIHKNNPSSTLNPDKIYVNVMQDSIIFSETLTESLLKKSIHEPTLLNNPLSGLYAHPETIDTEDQIKGLSTTELKNTINRLSTTVVNAYRQRIDDFWDLEKLSIPLELQSPVTNEILKALAKSISLIEKVYQIDSTYPNLKQSTVAYFSKKLKDLYNKDIHPSIVNILFFASQEKDCTTPLLTLNLIDFTLNKFKFTPYPSDAVMIQVTIGQNTESTALSTVFQESDLLAIKSTYQTKLKLFWRNNFNNYRVLAKFSFLRALFEQQNSTYKLSKKSFTLACQASLDLKQEEIRELDERNLQDINWEALFAKNPLGVFLLTSSHIEVSPFLINNQEATDILKIRDLQTNNILLYLPGYTPSFIEAKDERLLQHWVFHQTQLSQANFSAIASHFLHSSRLENSLKLDAFLCADCISQEKDIAEKAIQEDIFSFIRKKQSSRSFADLAVNRVPSSFDDSIPDYRSTDSAVFTTIAAAIEYAPYMLPNIHNTSSDLQELFPSPYQTASDLMKKGIKEKLHLDINPDHTFIRFSLHEVKVVYYDPTMPPISRRQKAKTTIQSLTQAALNNYRAQYSAFGYTIIIYQDPSGKGEYTSSDQLLNISPLDVEEIVQQADLDTLHKNKLTEFWAHHSDRMKYFIKHRYLQQALEAYHNKILSEESFKTVSKVAFYSLALEEGEAPSFTNPNPYVEIISVDSYQSTDMFVFRDTSQQEVILYIAGSKEPFFIFATYADCICFLEKNARKDVAWQKMLTSHFSMDVQDSVRSSLQRGPYVLFGIGLSSGFPLRGVACSFESNSIRHPIKTKPIEKNLFEVMQKNIQERSYLDANVIITSDEEVMLNNIINIFKSIEILLLVPSIAFPVLNWAVLATLITETSLNLYIAQNGDTVQERHQAAIDAGIGAVESLLIAFLSFRSLKFSKNQSLSNRAAQRALRSGPMIRRGGSGTASSLSKDPVIDEVFFNTTNPMQVWNISTSNRQFNYLDVKAWFLDEHFLLFTGKANKADHLIISSHGGYFPGTGIVKVPGNTELIVLGPHGWELVDPTTSSIAKKTVLVYGVINENSALPAQAAFSPSLLPRSSYVGPKTIDVKMLAGTNVPGHIKNYSLAKYQEFKAGKESYLDIIHIVNRSRNPFPLIHEVGLKPVDILTIRNRFGLYVASLQDVFNSLENNGIHYDRITLSFCRSNVFSSTFNLAPEHEPPIL